MSFETIEQQASYGVGRQLGEQLSANSFSGLDVSAVQTGLADALNGQESQVSAEDLQAAFTEISARIAKDREEQAKSAAADGEAFLAKNAEREDIQVTESGLQYEVLVEGEGESPSLDATVKCHYHGCFTDGRVFDSSVERGEPVDFPVSGVISGWTEALQMMKVGSKLKLYIPHNLAYGERGAGGAIPPYAALMFEVELLEIV